MKIVTAGGSGHLGKLLAQKFSADGKDVVILSRNGSGDRAVAWDAENQGEWTREIDGSDVVVNLAGRSVNCRYNAENQRLIKESRINSTRAIGTAIRNSSAPPPLWLQMSTATIYAHRFDAPNTESSGIIGGSEPNAPDTWRFSIDVATAWEAAVDEFDLPHTRIVKLRSSMVMSPEPEGIFDVLYGLVRKGLGGTNGSGRQYISWIHGEDFARAIDFLITNDSISGAVNVCSPDPLPNAKFMRDLREAAGVPIGLPAAEWMLEIGAVFLRTETELILKSRRVVPERLLEFGFEFVWPTWAAAAADLCSKRKNFK